MKFTLLVFTVLLTAYLFSSCDNGADSKSVSTSPPVLVSPSDGDTNVAVHTTFTWSGDAHVLWVDVSPDFSNPLVYNVTGNSFTLTEPLSVYTFYYWKAGKVIGSSTFWSENYYYFSTGGN